MGIVLAWIAVPLVGWTLAFNVARELLRSLHH